MSTRLPSTHPEIRALDAQIGQAEAQQRWPQAAQLLRTRAARVASVEEQVYTLEHLVSVYRVKLQDERSAVQVAEQVLRAQPSHAGARAYLEESYARTGDHAKRQALNAAAPAPAKSGGIFDSISTALGSAATAAGVAATGFASAVEASNRNPEWMRQQQQAPAAPAASPAQPARAAAAARPTRCAYCGADLTPGARACTACGAEL